MTMLEMPVTYYDTVGYDAIELAIIAKDTVLYLAVSNLV